MVRAIYQTRDLKKDFFKLVSDTECWRHKFYERAEIKDAVSYLRIINQKYDDLALERVIGTPKKRIGESTLNQIYKFGKENNLCLDNSIIKMLKRDEFKPKIKNTLNN